MLKISFADSWLEDENPLHFVERLKKNRMAFGKVTLEVFVQLADLAAFYGLYLDNQSLNALQPFFQKFVHLAVGLLIAINMKDQTIVGIEATGIVEAASGAFLLYVIIHFLDDDAGLHANLLQIAVNHLYHVLEVVLDNLHEEASDIMTTLQRDLALELIFNGIDQHLLFKVLLQSV